MTIWRLGDQTPPEPQRITDTVVDALRALSTRSTPASCRSRRSRTCRSGTPSRIFNARWDHLDWMHDHFADEVLLAGEDSETMRGALMRFSYCMLPDYPFDDMIDMIKTADELGLLCVLLGRRDLAQGPLGAVRAPPRARRRTSASARTSRTSSCASRR